MAYQTFRQEYFQIPVVTRAYTTACVITTLAVVSMTMKCFVIAIKNCDRVGLKSHHNLHNTEKDL